MGWITLDRAKSLSNKDFFQGQLGHESLEVLDAAQVDSVCYLAARSSKGVIALIVRFNWAPNAARTFSHNFGYKVEDETMGPYKTRCPERILDALSPLADLYDPDSDQYKQARHWRESCWRTIFEKRAKPRVVPGEVVKFARPITFVDGSEGDNFVFVKRSTFMLGDKRVRITDWRARRDYEVVEHADAANV